MSPSLGSGPQPTGSCFQLKCQAPAPDPRTPLKSTLVPTCPHGGQSLCCDVGPPSVSSTCRVGPSQEQAQETPPHNQISSFRMTSGNPSCDGHITGGYASPGAHLCTSAQGLWPGSESVVSLGGQRGWWGHLSLRVLQEVISGSSDKAGLILSRGQWKRFSSKPEIVGDLIRWGQRGRDFGNFHW